MACGYSIRICIPIPELRPLRGLLIRAHYLPEPGKASNLGVCNPNGIQDLSRPKVLETASKR